MLGFLENIKNNYLATGHGDLPFEQPQEACDFVFENFLYQVPFLPRLPKRSFFENDIVPFSEKLPGLKIDEARQKIWIDTRGPEFSVELEECFSRCMAFDVDYFNISRQSSPALDMASQRLMGMNWQGWFKLQVLGPMSQGMRLCDEQGKAIFFHEELNELITLVLSLRIAWLIKQFRVNVKTRIVVVIDESYICLKELLLSPQDIIEKMDRFINIIHDNGALAALKISNNKDCYFAEQLPLDILCFDAYLDVNRLDAYEKAASLFLKKSGMPILEIVPCAGEVLKDENLKGYLFKQLRARQLLLKNGALISMKGDGYGAGRESVQVSAEICCGLAEDLRLAF